MPHCVPKYLKSGDFPWQIPKQSWVDSSETGGGSSSISWEIEQALQKASALVHSRLKGIRGKARPLLVCTALMRRIRRRMLNLFTIPLSSPTLDNDPDASPTTFSILELRCNTQGSRGRLCPEQSDMKKYIVTSTTHSCEGLSQH